MPPQSLPWQDGTGPWSEDGRLAAPTPGPRTRRPPPVRAPCLFPPSAVCGKSHQSVSRRGLLGGYPVQIPPANDQSRLAELGPTVTRGLELIALRALGNAEEARDAVQEILARAVEAIRAARVPAQVPLGAFVHGIARHVLADARRRRIRDSAQVDVVVSPLPASQPSPLEALILQEERDRLRSALARLPAADRELLTRCFLEGESVQRLAERDGVPAERLRKRKSRALERLRDLLADGRGHVSPVPPISVA